jgi:hypothetical protein
VRHSLQSKSDDEVRHNLEQMVSKLSDDVLNLQQRAQNAEASQKDMATEHTRAMQDMQKATVEGRHACSELADAHERAKKADAASERAQQVSFFSVCCCSDAF